MKIKAVRTALYDIPPEVERVDAIQTFVSMEFPFVEIEDTDGVVGTGFSYTIGKGWGSDQADYGCLSHTYSS